MFEIGFAVEVDSEFPPDGAEPPQRIPPTLPRIGAVLRLTAPGAPPWDIAVGAPKWWRTPITTAIAFISDWRGYVADVVEQRVLIEVPGVIRIREDERHDLLLLITHTDLTAVGPDGVTWQSKQLASGDRRVDPVRVGPTRREARAPRRARDRRRSHGPATRPRCRAALRSA